MPSTSLTSTSHGSTSRRAREVAFKPRVLHVITPSRMAGAETFLARLMRRSDSAAHHSCVCKRAAVNVDMRAAGMEFEALGIGGKANMLAVPRLARAARLLDAQLLHSHLSTASWWCGWLEQLGGLPSIGHVHGFTSAKWHRRQTHLIACSAAVERHLIDRGIRPERITTIHYPVDQNDMRPTRSGAEVRAEFGAEPDTPIVGTFAHLSVKKGYHELIQAAALVLNVLPRTQFWCFGEGPLRPVLEQAARELGIADRFKLPGFRRDVPNLMHAVDVMCLPSHREPFGLVYVEAALAGKPSIACNNGGAPEIIAHKETGLLIPPPQSARSLPAPAGDPNSEIANNITALADAIFTLLDNRDAAAAMGRRGQELALARFQWADFNTRLRDLYYRVLSTA